MTGQVNNARSLHSAGLVVVGLTIASALAAACTDSEASPPTPIEDDAGAPPPGSTLPDAASDATADADEQTVDAGAVDACSSAGWCATEVDRRLSFDDLWPLESSAVAVASRQGRSSVLLYENASWKVIHEVPFLLSSVWASANDVWVSGDTGYVAHGRRENGGWTWTPHPLAVSTGVGVVWGTGERDVYALADARVWRLPLDADGGISDGATWSVDYGGASAPDPEITLTALVGRGEDDIWVTGMRGDYPRCGLALHKTRDGWVSVVDGTPTFSTDPFGRPTCEASGDAIAFDAPIGKAAATAKGEIVALAEVGFSNPQSFVRLRHQDDDSFDLTLAPRTADVTSLWGTSADDLYAASFSVVERGRDVWNGGAWEISTVAFAGVAIAKPFHVVRGTRNDNIWLAGESYAFHKTSP